MGHNPTKRIICASYADDLAHKLLVDIRMVLDGLWYRELFPQMQLASEHSPSTELVTARQAHRYAAGMSGSILGRRADLIAIDDPIKATDAVSKSGVPMRCYTRPASRGRPWSRCAAHKGR